MSSWRTAGPAIFGLVLSLALSPPARAQDPGEDLRRAASAGDAARVKELLAAGVDVNSANRYGGTALAFACDRGHLEVVKLLLDNGADPNTTDSFYQATPAAWAAMKGHVEILRALLEKGAEGEKQALMFAAHGGNKEIVQLVLERGKVGPDDLSAALAAADQEGNKEISELLRAKGAKPPAPADFKVDPAVLAGYEGVYVAPRQGMKIRFAIKDGKLTAMPEPGPPEPLALGAVDAVTFRLDQMPGVKLTFRSEGGKVTGLLLDQGGNTVELKKETP